MKCLHCNKPKAQAIKGPYRFLESGLDYVYLVGVTRTKCADCGESISIPRLRELHDCIARYIISAQRPLLPQEIRFLRSLIGWSQEKLAQKIGVSRGEVTRWENHQNKFSPQTDALLRLVWTHDYLAELGDDGVFSGSEASQRELRRIQDRIMESIKFLSKRTAKAQRMTIDVATLDVLDAA